ncbi:MAG: hypothetical protein AAB373_01095 [Patescibacteria group bacterium]
MKGLDTTIQPEETPNFLDTINSAGLEAFGRNRMRFEIAKAIATASTVGRAVTLGEIATALGTTVAVLQNKIAEVINELDKIGINTQVGQGKDLTYLLTKKLSVQKTETPKTAPAEPSIQEVNAQLRTNLVFAEARISELEAELREVRDRLRRTTSTLEETQTALQIARSGPLPPHPYKNFKTTPP